MTISRFQPESSCLMFVLSGPSGGGKTTLIREWRKTTPELGYVANITTRSPRPTSAIDETGIYEHVSRAEFRHMVEKNLFAQWARATKEKYKGTPIAPIEKAILQNRDLVFDLTPQEFMNLRRMFRCRTIGIFVVPPSIAELHNRLTARGTESGHDLEMKRAMGLEDIGYAYEHEYFIINSDISSSVEQLKSIRLAEHLRLERHPEIDQQCRAVSSSSMMFYYDPEKIRISAITDD